MIPVLLKAINCQRHDLQGLEAHQLFSSDRHKTFVECTTNATRQRFAEQLFDQIERRLDRLFGPLSSSTP